MVTDDKNSVSNSLFSDTIAALSTPSGKGAIALIRVSGCDAFASLSPYFAPINNKQFRYDLARIKKSRLHGVIIDQERIVDEVVLSLYHSPNSYTGEDLIEISCHCNPFIIQEVIQLLLRTARLANPGEFTERAFINEKLDLTRAEAVGDLLNVKTEYSHKAALYQLEGKLFEKITELLNELTECRLTLELEIDFGDQGVHQLNHEQFRERLERLKDQMERLLLTSKDGLIMREGLKVCLAGAPNVGKSSLFNSLLDNERAIVTATPGTTRDYLEESLSISGIWVRLFDTAGLRNGEDEAESYGILRSYDVLAQADIVLYIEDGSHIPENIIPLTQKDKPCEVIKVLNKADVLSRETCLRYQSSGYQIISAITSEGIKELQENIVSTVDVENIDFSSGILTNSRQKSAVERALSSLNKGIDSFEYGLGYEFTAFDLKESSEALEEIIGKIPTDDLLNQIFSNFCIGK
jgi:tRNA modification GTPase